MMQLEDWLDDLCVRFIINLPHEELGSVERICFQIEEAQWFYEDFIRPLDSSLPSLPLRNFSLLIFQHCPLFAGFPPEFFSEAFSQFLAYKTRVPVRGAIMLNENMDQVVLVKGWKKNANWSFPRGKINKDEKDLDCAVREVYEETGYDIKEAGLVLDENDMKYISVTIREQDVGLYVFRGVPMDTPFEPKTRKEISKIDWYKLSDLPTYKKNKQQEGNSESLAVNANKFYMVAPFLHELRRWISQQRKRDAVEGRHLPVRHAYEEPATATEDEQDHIDLRVPETRPAPSDLPEVSIPHDQTLPDVSSHLKALLNIQSTVPQATQPSPISPPSADADRQKSNALLNLLRGGPNPMAPQAEPRPYTPQDHLALSPEVPPSPHHNHLAMHQQSMPPPRFQAVGPGVASSAAASQPAHAPYQRTGDPNFARSDATANVGRAVPPASSLPQLSQHARGLLDAFKTQGPASSSANKPSPVPVASSIQQQMVSASTPQAGPPVQSPPAGNQSHRNTLLGLFGQPSTQTSNAMNLAPTRPQDGPAELSAQQSPAIAKSTVSNMNNATQHVGLTPKQETTFTGGVNRKQPPAMKILQRPQQPQSLPQQSQQGLQQIKEARLEATPSASRPFQPQILRRPVEAQQPQSQPFVPPAPTPNSTTAFDRRSSQTAVHKQALLSLFNRQAASTPTDPMASGMRSPLSAGGPSVTSPLEEKLESSLELDAGGVTPPVRSRMGSSSSFGGVLTPSSSRTTKPSDRAFLLQYLGGMAKGSS